MEYYEWFEHLNRAFEEATGLRALDFPDMERAISREFTAGTPPDRAARYLFADLKTRGMWQETYLEL